MVQLPILPQRDQCKPFTHFLFSPVLCRNQSSMGSWVYIILAPDFVFKCLHGSLVCEAVQLCVCVCIYSIYTYGCYLYVCEIERGMRSLESHTGTHAHTLVYPLCLLFSSSISCSYRATFIILLAGGRLPVTNLDGQISLEHPLTLQPSLPHSCPHPTHYLLT